MRVQRPLGLTGLGVLHKLADPSVNRLRLAQDLGLKNRPGAADRVV
jgi:hypothetical protein